MIPTLCERLWGSGKNLQNMNHENLYENKHPHFNK